MRIELAGVAKRFGEARALDGITLTLEAGSRVGLVGPNGSGKSTLLRALLGLVECEGRVLLDGRSPFGERAALAQRLAYVPQVAPALGAPVREVVRAVCALRGLEPAAVAALCARLELDLEACAAKPFRGLSGGMKQKLLIATALAAPAELLVLDEPTASLDAAARERFFRLVEERAGLATVLLCSHRLEEVRHLVDEVVALADGRLAFRGPASRFLEASAQSVVEVCLGEGGDDAWLRERGFRAGAQGWWHRAVGPADKLPLVRELTKSLNGTLRDLVVRDLEAVEVEQDGEEAGHG